MIAVIYRNDEDLNAVAILTCDTNAQIQMPDDLRKCLNDAVTDWMSNTEEGRDALNNACEDFNVGDLAEYVTDETLLPFLTKHGIGNLTLEIHSAPKTAWSFDDHLFNAREVGESRAEDDGD